MANKDFYFLKEVRIQKNPKIEAKQDKILCIHCKRTKNNQVSCLGICVADNEY